MNAGGNGLQSDINVTPLVDVVLVLLIIFMVVTPILQMGLDVEVPPKVEVTGPTPPSAQDQLVVTVKPDGIYLNASRVGDAKGLRERLAPILLGRPEPERIVFVSSDDKIAFEQSVMAMDAAREAGALKVGFLTDPPK